MDKHGFKYVKAESFRRIFIAGASLAITATAIAHVDESFSPARNSAQASNSVLKLEPVETSAPDEIRGAIKLPSVYFIEPKNGATVGREVKVKFGIDGGLKVEKAGEVVPGEGHFHVLIDSKPLARGQLVPTDAKHIHFPNGSTEGTLKLSPGKHKLTLLFGTGTHVSYGETLSQTIEVQVK